MSLITQYYLVLGAILFGLGTVGVLTRRNAIVVFMCIELMLNSVNLSVVALSRELNDPHGQILVFFVIAIAAAEAAVGLAIILTTFRNFYTVAVDEVDQLNG